MQEKCDIDCAEIVNNSREQILREEAARENEVRRATEQILKLREEEDRMKAHNINQDQKYYKS